MAVTVTRASLCAACFGAKTDVPHVDFEAAYEGPTLTHPDGTPQTIDDLIICEPCIREAAQALALTVDPIGPVQRERDAAQAEAKAWREYAEGLEEAHAERPIPIRRGRGRPRKRRARPAARREPIAA